MASAYYKLSSIQLVRSAFGMHIQDMHPGNLQAAYFALALKA